MRSLKVNFEGANKVSIDWNGEVSGISAVAQRAGVSLMTHEGSDLFLPERGTKVAQTLFGYGAFNMMGMQHTLNFGGLKARSDMRAYELPGRAPEDRIGQIRVTLVDIRDNVAFVGITVSNLAGQQTRTITEIE